MWQLYIVLVLSAMFFSSELIASQLAQSLLLLMDSYHMLYNFLSLLLLIISYRASKTKTPKNTFGWARLEILGVLVNILFFAALCFAVMISGIQELIHLRHRPEIPNYPFLILIFGVIRLILNIVAFILIGGGCDSHLMMDLLRDNSGCLLIICCGLLVYYKNGYVPPYVELVFSALAIAILFLTSYHFVQESSLILLQTIPHHMNMEALKKRLIQEFPVILNIHDIHIWQLNSSQTIATVHVVLSSIPVYLRIATQLANFFKKEGISMITIQPEFCEGYSSWKKMECILRCSPVYNCGTLTCCGHLLRKKSKSKTDNLDRTPQLFTINSVDETYDLPKFGVSDLHPVVF